MNVLNTYDAILNVRSCKTCLHHVTRPGNKEDLHFCEVSGKILLWPKFIPQNCKKFKKE